MKKLRVTIGILVILGLIVGSTGFAKAEEVERSYCLVYIVKKGDCLWSIVENTFTKDTAYWVKVTAKENKIEPPYLICPGQEILIPLPPPIEVLEEEKAVSPLEERMVALEESLKGAGKLIAEAVVFQAEKIEGLKAAVEGVKRIESEQIKAFERMEGLANQIRNQGWIVISVVVVGMIIALIVIFLLLRRYYITKLKEAEIGKKD